MSLTDPSERPTVLVTDGRERAALAVVRSLGRAGYLPYVTAPAIGSLAGGSKYCVGELALPNPLDDAEAFAATLSARALELDVAAVLPITDAALLAVLERPHLFRDVGVPFPELAAFSMASNKAEIARLAREVGIAVPESVEVEAPGVLSTEEARALAYPVVIKPSRSVFGEGEQRRKIGVSYAQDPERLITALAALPPDAYPVLLQERVQGPGMGVFLLVWDGEVRARFAHRRLREKPPSGGVSVLRESIHCDDEVFDRSAALLHRCGWRGVAMIEYKLSDATGIPYLMEVNGRFWGSLQLAIDSGVDFPRILVDSMVGEPVSPSPPYRSGVRSRWLLGDLDHLLIRLRHDRVTLSLPPDAPGRAGVIWNFLSGFFGAGDSEVFRWSDPRPFVREARGWMRELVSGG